MQEIPNERCYAQKPLQRVWPAGCGCIYKEKCMYLLGNPNTLFLLLLSSIWSQVWRRRSRYFTSPGEDEKVSDGSPSSPIWADLEEGEDEQVSDGSSSSPIWADLEEASSRSPPGRRGGGGARRDQYDKTSRRRAGMHERSGKTRPAMTRTYPPSHGSSIRGRCCCLGTGRTGGRRPSTSRGHRYKFFCYRLSCR